MVEEVDESVFWLELLSESEISNNEATGSMLKEATEIMKVASASRKTAKDNRDIHNYSIILLHT